MLFHLLNLQNAEYDCKERMCNNMSWPILTLPHCNFIRHRLQHITGNTRSFYLKMLSQVHRSCSVVCKNDFWWWIGKDGVV